MRTKIQDDTVFGPRSDFQDGQGEAGLQEEAGLREDLLLQAGRREDLLLQAGLQAIHQDAGLVAFLAKGLVAFLAKGLVAFLAKGCD